MKSSAVLPPKDSFLSLWARGGCQLPWLGAASPQSLPLSSQGLPTSRPSPLVFSSKNSSTGLGARSNPGSSHLEILKRDYICKDRFPNKVTFRGPGDLILDLSGGHFSTYPIGR